MDAGLDTLHVAEAAAEVVEEGCWRRRLAASLNLVARQAFI
jgi:hypothetical protein